jgi:hypothetical protein
MVDLPNKTKTKKERKEGRKERGDGREGKKGGREEGREGGREEDRKEGCMDPGHILIHGCTSEVFVLLYLNLKSQLLEH